MDTAGLQQRLDELVDTLEVPGAVLGVSRCGERFVAAAGIAGLNNPAPVTPDTAFQLGSISKLYTATLLLILAGSQILDQPVSQRVPEAGWMDPAITVGHLLTHSSGLGGDWFADTGRGDDALARYTTELAHQPNDHPLAPGTRYSYCNSGYAVLGRLIEVVSGQTYDTALAQHLLTPLGVHRTTTLPEDTILGPAALGHNRRDPGPLTADDAWSFARAGGPLGGITATAGDVLGFAEHHLAARDPALAPMRERRLETPPHARPSARGLGFGIYDLDGGTVCGHDGETLGQIAGLRLAPEHELAVVVLTNAIPDGSEITRQLIGAVLGQWGMSERVIDVSGPPRGFDPSPYLGRYRNLMGSRTVAADADSPGLQITTRFTTEGLVEETEIARFVPIGGHAFVDRDEPAPTRALSFADPDAGGRMQSCFAGRIAWRTPPDG